MQERALAERLITYDTSTLDGIRSAAGFVKGWIEARDIDVNAATHNGRPVLAATVGAAEGPTIVLHGHLDVVPGNPEQFVPRVEEDRLYGRGAYDMKGGLAAMMVATCELASQQDVRVHFVCVSDEESEEPDQRGSDFLVEQGYVGDFAITGEPTDLRIGIEAKGVLALRIEVRGTGAHGSTPWKGDNAVLKALDVVRHIESLPFTRESSEMFDRASVNLGRIAGGDAINRVPEQCTLGMDIRYLPGQDPEAILAAIREDESVERISVGRDGASDAVSFLEAGVPAVEFGPIGAGHHGPEEWVSVSSLERYRRTLVDFVNALPSSLGKGHLRVA